MPPKKKKTKTTKARTPPPEKVAPPIETKKRKTRSKTPPPPETTTKTEEEEEEDVNVAIVETTKKQKTTLTNPRKEGVSRRRTTSSLEAPIVLLEGHAGAVNDVKFSTDGKFIATAGSDACVRLWSYDFDDEDEDEVEEEEEKKSKKKKNNIENRFILRGHKNAVLSLAFLSDQFSIASASADKSIRVWDVEYAEQVKKYDKSHSRAINCVSANERGTSLIVSASDDGFSKVFDARVAKKEVMQLKHKYPVVSCAFRQDGLECATSGADGIVRTWDLRYATSFQETTNEEVRARVKNDVLCLDTKMTALTMKEGHEDIVTGLAYSYPDGFELASVGMDGKCNLFDLKPFRENADARVEMTYKGVQTDFEKRVIKCCSSSPSISANVSSKPTYISSGSACGNVFVWDQKTGKIKYKLPGHKGSCLSVAFHPFEPVLASAGADGKVFLVYYEPSGNLTTTSASEHRTTTTTKTNEQKRMPQTTTKAFAGEAASFPSSPPTSFDKSNPYEDPVAFVQQREHDTRERMIDVEKAKLIRERLRECYRNEGVNHFENCKDLVEKYTEAFEGKSFARINIMRDSK